MLSLPMLALVAWLLALATSLLAMVLREVKASVGVGIEYMARRTSTVTSCKQQQQQQQQEKQKQHQ